MLEKLNFLNDEKERRIKEIEGLFKIDKARPGGSKQFEAVSSARAPVLEDSYMISQNIIQQVKAAAEQCYVGTIQG